MKLTIEHLAPYLPYKIRVIDTIVGRSKVMNTGQGSSNHWVGIKTVLNYEGRIYKPILRPLSDLTIEDAKLFNYPDEGHLERSILSGHTPYEVWIEFVENHFDVFGLIDQNLAIDINTLEP